MKFYKRIKYTENFFPVNDYQIYITDNTFYYSGIYDHIPYGVDVDYLTESEANNLVNKANELINKGIILTDICLYDQLRNFQLITNLI